MAKNTTISYEVKEVIGVLDSDSTMPKELRRISWNGNEPKYDLRNWGTDKDGNEKCSKGCTFDKEELYSLYEILKKMFELEEV